VRALALLALAACGGGRVPVPQACVDYYNCGAKTGWTDCYAFDDPRNNYGSNGSCWDTAQTADQCTKECAAANDSFKSTGLAADAGCTFSQ
jgi:hypothetical protein